MGGTWFCGQFPLTSQLILWQMICCNQSVWAIQLKWMTGRCDSVLTWQLLSTNMSDCLFYVVSERLHRSETIPGEFQCPIKSTHLNFIIDQYGSKWQEKKRKEKKVIMPYCREWPVFHNQIPLSLSIYYGTLRSENLNILIAHHSDKAVLLLFVVF